MNTLDRLKERYERDAQIKKDLNKGATPKEIRLKYKVSKLVKYKDDAQFAESQRKMKERIDDLEKLIEDFKNGKSHQELADERGISRQAVSELLLRLGLTWKDGGLHTKTLEKEREVLASIKAGKTVKDIKILHKVDAVYIKKVAEANGLTLITARQERINRAVELRKQGKTQAEIGAILGVTQNAVSQYLIAAAPKSRKPRGRVRSSELNQRDEKVVQLYKNFKSVPEIAKEVGRSELTIRQILSKYSIMADFKKEVIKQRHEQVIDLYQKGMAIKEIVNITKYSDTSIFRILQENGIESRRRNNTN